MIYNDDNVDDHDNNHIVWVDNSQAHANIHVDSIFCAIDERKKIKLFVVLYSVYLSLSVLFFFVPFFEVLSDEFARERISSSVSSGSSRSNTTIEREEKERAMSRQTTIR